MIRGGLILVRLGTCLLALALVLSLWASPNRSASLPWCLIGLAGVVLVGLVSSPLLSRLARRIRPAHVATFFVIAATGALGAALLTSRWSEYKFTWLNAIYSALPSVRSLPFSWAKQGLSPNQTGGFLAVCLAMTTVMAALPWRPREYARASAGDRAGTVRRWASGFLTVAGFMVVFMTGSRAGLAGLCIAIVLVFLFRTYRWWWAWASAVCAAIVGLAISGRLPSLFHFFVQDETLNTKLIARLDIWSSALHGIQDHMITGIGLGVFNEVMPIRYPYQTVGLSFSVSGAHNLFLDVALTIGIPGLLGLILLLVGCILLAIKGLRLNNPSRTLCLGILVSIVAFLIFGITDQISFSIPTSFIVWIWAFCLIMNTERSRLGLNDQLGEAR